jgi:RES domain-containing protein
MSRAPLRRDHTLIDAIEVIAPVSYTGNVWRIVKEGRDPLEGRASGGRWDDGSFDVLYTSLAREGALAEMYFHLRRGQPIFPSKVRYELFEITLTFHRALRLLDLSALEKLGVQVEHFGKLSYEGRAGEYPRTQDIAEIAHFLEYDGLLVPSARHDCQNAIVFCDQHGLADREVHKAHGLIDRTQWPDKS